VLSKFVFLKNSNTNYELKIFCFENPAVYEIRWENIVQPDRPQMAIWRMRIACWIPKATSAHSEYVILIISFIEMLRAVQLANR
jgi:hypothetical protein